MQWTQAKIDQIPEVYQDFLLALKPVIDSRTEVLKINAVPLGRVFNGLSTKYDYGPAQVRALADNLIKGGLVEEDRHSFLIPTKKGEALIKAIADRQPVPVGVPPLPSF